MINQWTKELDQATAQIPTEEHDRFLHALDEIERASKDAVRREWACHDGDRFVSGPSTDQRHKSMARFTTT